MIWIQVTTFMTDLNVTGGVLINDILFFTKPAKATRHSSRSET